MIDYMLKIHVAERKVFLSAIFIFKERGVAEWQKN